MLDNENYDDLEKAFFEVAERTQKETIEKIVELFMNLEKEQKKLWRIKK